MELNDSIKNSLGRMILQGNYNVKIRSMESQVLQIKDTEHITIYDNETNATAEDVDDPCDGESMMINASNCRGILKEFQSSHWFTPSQEALLIVFYCVAIILGILGNSIVVYIVLKFKHLHKPRNFLILNLSACGIIMCIACMPFSLIRLTLKNWELGDFLCRLSPTLQTIDVFVSTFTIVAIAVDRYSAIVCASRESSNRKLVYYSISLIWFCSIILCIPMMMFHEVQEVYPEALNVQLYTICMEVWPFDWMRKLYTTCVLLIQYAAPLAIISVLHGRICRFLRLRINDNPRTDLEMARVLRDIKRQRKNMLLLTGIAVSFAVAWLPLTVLNTLADYDFQLFLNRNFNHAYAYCLLAAMCSACLNPIIYGWFNSNFKKAFLLVLCSIKHSVTDLTEMATIKNDSKGNSHQPYRFYSSLRLDSADPLATCRSISSRSASKSSSQNSIASSKSCGSKSAACKSSALEPIQLQASD
ncbi:neuropeptide Y receptor type 2-like [Mercenaria mercenaria]|uniref:neuropeptide Y receptor type 2-like n=1 Tax=Mercenaria mercenaria TaxID=6596 RepID=UPI00234E452E|nr:neuropeptide Y receptor type 2-like [Mercenaria mercenaria]